MEKKKKKTGFYQQLSTNEWNIVFSLFILSFTHKKLIAFSTNIKESACEKMGLYN